MVWDRAVAWGRSQWVVVRDSGRGQYVEQWDRVIEKGQKEPSLLGKSSRITQWKEKVTKCSKIKQWQRQRTWVLEQGIE